MADFIQPMAYAGIQPIYLRTYDAAYPYTDSHWGWNGQSIYPMEYVSYRAASQIPVAMSAQLIDLTTGYSKTVAGNVASGAIVDGDYNFTYDLARQTVRGFVIDNETRTRFPAYGEYYLPYDGMSRVYAWGVSSIGTSFPQPGDSGMPNIGHGINFLVGGGNLYSSAEEDFDPYSGIKSTIFNLYSSDLINLSFPTDARFGATLYNGANDYIYVVDGTGGSVPYNGIVTDYMTFSKTFTVNAASPASSTVDFNAYFADSTNQTALCTKEGWLSFDSSTQTFDGVTLNGFGVLIAIDFSSYKIIQLLPQDNLSAAIFTGAGNGGVSGKIDRNGNLFLKTANVPGVLYVGEVVQQNSPPSIIKDMWRPPFQSLIVNPGFYK